MFFWNVVPYFLLWRWMNCWNSCTILNDFTFQKTGVLISIAVKTWCVPCLYLHFLCECFCLLETVFFMVYLATLSQVYVPNSVITLKFWNCFLCPCHLCGWLWLQTPWGNNLHMFYRPKLMLHFYGNWQCAVHNHTTVLLQTLDMHKKCNVM
jgi:hypothetical protein